MDSPHVLLWKTRLGQCTVQSSYDTNYSQHGGLIKFGGNCQPLHYSCAEKYSVTTSYVCFVRSGSFLKYSIFWEEKNTKQNEKNQISVCNASKTVFTFICCILLFINYLQQLLWEYSRLNYDELKLRFHYLKLSMSSESKFYQLPISSTTSPCSTLHLTPVHTHILALLSLSLHTHRPPWSNNVSSFKTQLPRWQATPTETLASLVAPLAALQKNGGSWHESSQKHPGHQATLQGLLG